MKVLRVQIQGNQILVPLAEARQPNPSPSKSPITQMGAIDEMLSLAATYLGLNVFPLFIHLKLYYIKAMTKVAFDKKEILRL